MRPRRHGDASSQRRGGRRDRRRLRDSAPGWRSGSPVGGRRCRPARLRAHGSAGRALFQRCADLRSVEFGRRLCLCLRQLSMSGEYGWSLGVPGWCRDRGKLQVTTFDLPRWIGGRLSLRFGNLHLPLVDNLKRTCASRAIHWHSTPTIARSPTRWRTSSMRGCLCLAPPAAIACRVLPGFSFPKCCRPTTRPQCSRTRRALASPTTHSWSKPASGADQCTECAECEPKCPQNIPIIEMLARAHGPSHRALIGFIHLVSEPWKVLGGGHVHGI